MIYVYFGVSLLYCLVLSAVTRADSPNGINDKDKGLIVINSLLWPYYFLIGIGSTIVALGEKQ